MKTPPRQARVPHAERLLVYIILFGAAFIAFLPYVWMILAAFKTSAEIHLYPPQWLPSVWRWENFGEAWRKAPFGLFFVNSVIVTASIVAIQLVTSTLAAFAFARFEFPGKNILFLLYLSILMVPAQVTLIPNFVTIKQLSLLNTYGALILPFVASGFGTFLIRQQFLTIPTDLIEAARMDGAGPLRILWSLMVPLSRAALATFSLLSAMWHWNDFFWPLIVTNSVEMRTMPLGLAVFTQGEAGTEWHLLMAASIFTALPIVALFLLAQKQFVQGIANVGLKG
ncbi:MAG: carbohydrate ABC transporter permease [Chloroflexi bacterium]|nr:carbohydrate ABC transporter permease [Chloroflexota bacterium]